MTQQPSEQPSLNKSSNGAGQNSRIAIAGASGYAGVELIRLALAHPHIDIKKLSAHRHSGKEIAEIWPHLYQFSLPKLEDLSTWQSNQTLADVDALFLALPHGVSHKFAATWLRLNPELVIFDLGADFRLNSAADFSNWYQQAHQAPELLASACYGLTEIHSATIKTSRLIAIPGCYPTAAILPLYPLLQANLIEPDITIDAKSGLSGAGRGLKENLLFCEVNENLSPYGLIHRHTAEIEQELAVAAGTPVQVGFTPHLIPMTRGTLSSIYLHLRNNVTIETLRAELRQRYAGCKNIYILPPGKYPQVKNVRGTNGIHIGVFQEHRPQRCVIFVASDNLMKGAAGQAMENFNLRFNYPAEFGIMPSAFLP